MVTSFNQLLNRITYSEKEDRFEKERLERERQEAEARRIEEEK